LLMYDVGQAVAVQVFHCGRATVQVGEEDIGHRVEIERRPLPEDAEALVLTHRDIKQPIAVRVTQAKAPEMDTASRSSWAVRTCPCRTRRSTASAMATRWRIR
jgi:hypothetical protein